MLFLLHSSKSFLPKHHSIHRSLLSRRIIRPLLHVSTENLSSEAAASSTAYPFKEVEKKWQERWEKEQTFKTPERDLSKPKKYILDMFPYPSGAGLHVGHPEGYTASDIMARYYRMKGYDVLHPIGWDSFGLPAEQFAIQTGTPPAETTKANIKTFKRQLKMLGFSYDWDKEIATTDVEYVKWTQWIFLQLFKKGLATQSEVSVNWCAALGTVLANEEVIDGLSERGSHPVVRLPLRQWILKITEYADRLEEGLETLDWPQGTLVSQKQWIGRSEGTNIDFEVEGIDGEKITVFTTRPDTLYGVTYLTLAPEHPLVPQITTPEQKSGVDEYVAASSSKSDLDRTSQTTKTGVFTGGYAVHPLTKEKVPIWVGDYVLGGYGTGAVMAVPAHDTRDFDFAKEFDLDVKWVVAPSDGEEWDKSTGAFVEPGVSVSSGDFSGMSTDEVKKGITEKLSELKKGGAVTTYKLRDWVFSRQRYWGEPIPIYFPVTFPEGVDPSSVDLKVDSEEVKHTIEFNSPIPVDEDDLPLKLPITDDFQPGDDPAGCLARCKDWRYFQKDGKWFARETNTMPQWAGSCWYYFRYMDPKNSDAAFSEKSDSDWMPVDLYIGGSEHAVLHLLYARFWHQVLFDLGVTKSPEPFQKLVHQGMILGSDGEKMSKSRGNVVNPDDIVGDQGADALRMYEMFMGPLEAVKPWQTSQVAGVVRFQQKLYKVVQSVNDQATMSKETEKLLHKTMKKVTEDIDAMSFNTAISALMVFTNHLQSLKQNVPREAAEALSLMVSPFGPHLGEECWSLLGHDKSLAYHPWVTFDESKCVDDTVKMGVQVNGKKRGEIEVGVEAGQDKAMELATQQERVANQLEGKDIKKIIYVPGRILNIVAK